MKIKSEYKVREMAGEHVVIMQGRFGADMTRVISLNNTSLLLWNSLCDKEFELEDVVALLTSNYEVDEAVARRDAAAWLERMRECGLVTE